MSEEPTRMSAGQWAVAWRRFKRNKVGVAGLAMVLFYIFTGVYGLFFAPYPVRSFQCLYEGCTSLPPFVDLAHPFGTEQSGIDIFSEILHGTINDLYVGVVATLISVGIGVLIGGLAGYRSGVSSSFLLGVTQAFLVIPILVLILLFARIGQLLVAQGLGLTLITIILGVFGWPLIAYIVRGEILRIRELEFIQAERALGASNTRILFRHVLPNVLSPLIVYSSLLIAGNILTEVVVSFLGFGDPNTSTWGLLLQEGFDKLRTTWWVSVFPGLAVVFCVLGFNLLGDGLSDALNPRLRE
ncbi:MAG: ABC transporter permease [Thaumarchaeota archaeon]|nr:ABC transporter permease [Nitrososphaerota archaeon]